jgi:hypothetical protein
MSLEQTIFDAVANGHPWLLVLSPLTDEQLEVLYMQFSIEEFNKLDAVTGVS